MKKLKILSLALCCVMLVACGKKEFSKMSFKDGVYDGLYVNDGEHKDTMKVKIEIKDNKILSASMEALDEKGNLKDENYGKDSGEKNYELAQRAVQAMQKYPEQLVEVQDPEMMDGEAGATVSLKEFKEAVWNALEQAKK